MKQDDSQKTSRKQILAAAAFYAAVLIILFHRVVFSGFMLLPLDLVHEAITPWASPDTELNVKTHYTSDSILEIYPLAHYAYRGLKDEGRFPLWISSVNGGRPLLGDSIHVFLNPFNILWLFMSSDAAWNYRLLLQLFFAGFFMYLFVREIRISHVGGLFSGLCYMLNSMFVVLLLRNCILGGFVWVPL
ncbi:MAG: hypothetical protein JRJ14_02490, partial [Deltaproteobacteria bacterium]|nr:hypothetical protein [Deltaproteobacteria bacterium]